MSDDKTYTVKGTPKEIASAINSMDDNGVKFDEGAELTDHETGETKIMEDGGLVISDAFPEYLWFLYWDKESV